MCKTVSQVCLSFFFFFLLLLLLFFFFFWHGIPAIVIKHPKSLRDHIHDGILT